MDILKPGEKRWEEPTASIYIRLYSMAYQVFISLWAYLFVLVNHRIIHTKKEVHYQSQLFSQLYEFSWAYVPQASPHEPNS